MAGRTMWNTVIALAFGAVLAAPAGAQQQADAASTDTAYRCATREGVTYSQVPCPGGRRVGPGVRRVTDKWKPPPQDRAVAAKRARLSAGDRQECARLDRGMADEERMLKTRGEAATLDDEMPLVRMKKQFRELRC